MTGEFQPIYANLPQPKKGLPKWRSVYLSMRGTAVLRWEMRPGEIFFLVYSLDRQADNLTAEVTSNQAVFIKYNLYLTR